MSRAHRRVPLQVFRIASLFVPSALAWQVASSARAPSHTTEAIAWAIGPLWLLAAVAVAYRCLRALARPRRSRAAGRPTLLAQIDVLTASGSAMAWLSAGAISGAILWGWGSLSVVGLLGVAAVHLAVAWTCARTSSADPIGAASLTRAFAPAVVLEGEPVTEELCFDGARIPLGFRLFACGRVGPRWPTTRAVLEAGDAGGEVRIETDVGPARRGVHAAEPVELWLQDVFGLCATPRLSAGAAVLTVLPRPRVVDEPRRLLARGDGDGPELRACVVRAPRADGEPRPSTHMPTEGSFRLREYQQGDDARRIHWVRSLAARQMVVRLPDEILPDRPAIRLVLDTFLPGAAAVPCDAPAALLDGMVAVWLGIARALAQGGARVTLVVAGARVPSGPVTPLQARWAADAQPALLRLGAGVAWQASVHVDDLLPADAAARTMVVACRVSPEAAGRARWILVPEPAWTCFEESFRRASPARFAHPMGSADNRWTRRRRERAVQERALRDHTTFAGMCGGRISDLVAGQSFVARPAEAGKLRLEALS